MKIYCIKCPKFLSPLLKFIFRKSLHNDIEDYAN